MELKARFWSRVDKRGEDECWPWTGAKVSRGYGRISVNGKAAVATQVSWSIANGKPFPVGLFACHACDNPSCVNPKHIWPGTAKENIQDAERKGRMVHNNPGYRQHWTHCVKGHEFDEANTYFHPSGRRQCRKCRAAGERAKRAANDNKERQTNGAA